MNLTNHLISWMVYCYIQRKSRGVVTCVGGWIQLRFVCPQLSARDPSLHSSVCILIMSSFPSGRWTVISLCQSAWHRLDLKTYSLICGLSIASFSSHVSNTQVATEKIKTRAAWVERMSVCNYVS